MAGNVNTTENKATFDRNADVNLSAEQLSYICKYCGKVNPIGASNCVRCGKRRPRSEYINAMKKLDSTMTVRQEFIAEQVKAETALKDERERQINRIVESRVEDARAQMYAQQEVRLDQDREDIKRAAARDAVLRIIAAENAAETRVAEAEARADAIIAGKSKEIDDLIAAEHEKALNAAAEKLVAERAAIEEAAKERVEQNRRATEFDAAKQIEIARDEAERVAARQAVLRIIAAEDAAADQIRLSRDAYQQAATERIVEERILADKEAAARFSAEKQAIEKAAEERIRAEREAVKRILEGRGGGYPTYSDNGTVQPFTIVPYVNPNQPVYQYNPERVVYKFVPDRKPDNSNDPSVEQITYYDGYGETGNGKRVPREQTGKARVCGLISAILALVVVVFSAVIGFVAKKGILNITDGKLIMGSNTSVFLGFFAYLIDWLNSTFKMTMNVPEMFMGDYYVTSSLYGSSAAGVLAFGVFGLTVVALVALIVGIVRTVTSRGSRGDFVMGALMTVFMIVVIACDYVLTKDFKAVLTLGNIVLLLLSIVILVCSIIGGSAKKKFLPIPEGTTQS